MIISERIKLRAIEETDSSFYFNWINDSESNKWRGLYHPVSSTAALSAIRDFSDSKNSTALALTITDISNNPIGLVGLRGICSRSRRAEIWIYIGDKSFWGQGLGQEVLSAMVNYGFNDMNLHRIWLECSATFAQGIRCYEKVGFQKEGILKDGYFRNGKYQDTMIMAILRTTK